MEGGAKSAKAFIHWVRKNHLYTCKRLNAYPTAFDRFLAREKVEDLHLVERAVQRAIVEVWVLKQNGGDLQLPISISNPTVDFEDRLATGVTFHKDDSSIRFTDDALREEIEQSLGLRQIEESEAGTSEESYDHVDEDMIRGYPEEGKRPPRAAPLQTGFEIKDSESTEEANTENTVETSSEDLIAASNLEPETEAMERERESCPAPDQSYRDVIIAGPDLKFAVSLLIVGPLGTHPPYKLN